MATDIVFGSVLELISKKNILPKNSSELYVFTSDNNLWLDNIKKRH